MSPVAVIPLVLGVSILALSIVSIALALLALPKQGPRKDD